MTKKPKMTKQEAIDELRKEALEIEGKATSIKEYASIAHKVKLRRDLADKFELELTQRDDTKQD